MVAKKPSSKVTKTTSKKGEAKYQISLIIMAVAFVVMSCLWFVTFNISNEQNTTIDELNQTVKNLRDSGAKNGVVSYDGQNDKTALELLKDAYEVKTKDFSGVGEFVTAINGVEAEDGTNFWAFYVNGEMATEGASTYKTKDGEKIEWRLDEIQ